jgi:hypothetical protein
MVSVGMELNLTVSGIEGTDKCMQEVAHEFFDSSKSEYHY